MNMIIVWSIVIGAALLIEFLTYNLVTLWFAVAGIASLILAACEVPETWQLVVFVVGSLALVLALRPFVRKFVKGKTVPTNTADKVLETVTKLTSDVKEGRSTIVINAVTWTALCSEKLTSGTEVKIIGVEGNKFIVEKFIKSEEKKS